MLMFSLNYIAFLDFNMKILPPVAALQLVQFNLTPVVIPMVSVMMLLIPVILIRKIPLVMDLMMTVLPLSTPQ